MKQVLFAPDVEEDLFQLIRILVEKHYLSTFDYAVSYVEDLVEYINEHIHTYPIKMYQSISSDIVRMLSTYRIIEATILRGILYSRKDKKHIS